MIKKTLRGIEYDSKKLKLLISIKYFSLIFEMGQGLLGNPVGAGPVRFNKEFVPLKSQDLLEWIKS